MRAVLIEKSPDEDLPFYFDMAESDDVKELFVPVGTETIGSHAVTDWSGNGVTDVTVADSHSGTELLLRIAGGILNTTKLIKTKIITSPNNYKLDLFVILMVRHPKTDV